MQHTSRIDNNVTTKHIAVEWSSILKRNTNYGRGQAVDCVYVVLLVTTIIYSHINVPQLVQPPHDKCKISPGQSITVTTKQILVKWSSSMEKIYKSW